MARGKGQGARGSNRQKKYTPCWLAGMKLHPSVRNGPTDLIKCTKCGDPSIAHLSRAMGQLDNALQ